MGSASRLIGRRHIRKKKPKLKYYRINQYITAPKVRLIDPKVGMIGIVDLTEALKRAEEKNSDLVEISPKEDPPVVKILNFGRFKYNLEKKKQKTKTKKVGLKGIRLTLNMAAHDRETKIKRAQKFLEQGHKTQLEMLLKGRQLAHVNRAFDQIKDFIETFQQTTVLIQPPNKKGRRITAILQPTHNKK